MISGSLHINRGKYFVSFRVRDKNGRQKQKFISTGIPAVKGNKRKAEAKMLDILEKYDDITELSGDDAYFEVYIWDWICRVKDKVQHTTYDGYVHMFQRHIEPYFKGKSLLLIDVKPMHMEQYYAEKVAEGLSPNTVIKHHAIIRSALQDAVKNGYIKVNPADLADKPKRVKASHDFYSVEELKQLLAVTKGTDLELPVFLAITFGLRRSECLGLRWSNIDLENKVLYIKEKVTICNIDGKIRDVASDRLKTDSSVSEFYLNDTVCRYLAEVKEKQSKMIRITKEFVDYVCVNPIGERIRSDQVTHKFHRLLKENGMRPIRFHDLRHSCISLLVKNNFNMKSVQEYARHADFTLTANTYAHLENKVKLDEIDSITSMLFDEE